MASWGKGLQTNASQGVSECSPTGGLSTWKGESHVEAETPTLSPRQQPHLQSSESWTMLVAPGAVGSVKNKYGMDLTEAEDIKKKWQEYTEELYKKDLQHQDNHLT